MAKPKRSHYKTRKDFEKSMSEYYKRTSTNLATYVERITNFCDKQERRNAEKCFELYHDHKARLELGARSVAEPKVRVFMFSDSISSKFNRDGKVKAQKFTFKFDNHTSVVKAFDTQFVDKYKGYVPLTLKQACNIYS